MPDSAIRILLNHTKWDKEDLLLRLTHENRAEFIANANIFNPFENVDGPELLPEQNPQNFSCAICLGDTAQEVHFMALSDLHVNLFVRFHIHKEFHWFAMPTQVLHRLLS